MGNLWNFFINIVQFVRHLTKTHLESEVRTVHNMLFVWLHASVQETERETVRETVNLPFVERFVNTKSA